jgi:hypothetical protein
VKSRFPKFAFSHFFYLYDYVAASQAKVRELEIQMAEMVDVDELDAAEARAAALELEADALRATVRALEAEMGRVVCSFA